MGINFCLPIDLTRLQNDRLKLVPLEDCSDAIIDLYVTETSFKHPELFEYFPGGPFASTQEYKAWYQSVVYENPASSIFAIFLKAGKIQRKNPATGDIDVLEVANGTFAGTTGLINASVENSTVEIGHVMLLPQFHRTFVNTHATAVLLKHLLDPISTGDLEMRRVQWQANSMNKPSIAAAQRLGMKLEGIIRWQRVIADNKENAPTSGAVKREQMPSVDKEGRNLGPGRHSAMLAICWDDWLEGGRDHILNLLER
ncbi:hypothetical protein H2198_006827 [Neophaeococcomyces mojaviensis]|uniref:Uncharacterized protein n=1 Tax=Neophaeococcomyces mojaviensis TaxID=3383035 RepID=A0ACC3A1R8_9EURO|nr:hypothetical protein H2198_006827 [Knufia sp. JES_112]